MQAPLIVVIYKLTLITFVLLLQWGQHVLTTYLNVLKVFVKIFKSTLIFWQYL